ncbi:hypothetical protein GJ496_002870 [Pomphorhynchus laevis]|nr:hypothetical protein GJ496_002870 [Pomphorhynchus laevis]
MKGIKESYQDVSHKIKGWTAKFEPNARVLSNENYNSLIFGNESFSSCSLDSLSSTFQTLEQYSETDKSALMETTLTCYSDENLTSLAEISDPERFSLSPHYTEPIMQQRKNDLENSSTLKGNRKLTKENITCQNDKIPTIGKLDLLKFTGMQLNRFPVEEDGKELLDNETVDVVIERWLPCKKKQPRRILEIKYIHACGCTRQLRTKKEICVETIHKVDPRLYKKTKRNLLSEQELLEKVSELGLSDVLSEAEKIIKKRSENDQKIKKQSGLKKQKEQTTITNHKTNVKNKLSCVKVIEVSNDKDLGRVLVKVLTQNNNGSRRNNNRTSKLSV